MKDSPAEKAGLLSGDIIVSLNGQPLGSSAEFIEIVSQKAGVELNAEILRGTETLNIAVTPGSDGKIGIAIKDIFEGKSEYKTFGFFESFYVAGVDLVNLTKVTFSVAGKVIGGQVEFGKAFGGPVRIAQLAAKSADVGIESFLFFLAVLSLSLALINIMPFPVLDGGHLLLRPPGPIPPARYGDFLDNPITLSTEIPLGCCFSFLPKEPSGVKDCHTFVRRDFCLWVGLCASGSGNRPISSAIGAKLLRWMGHGP